MNAMSRANEDDHHFYSQVTAAAMHDELERQRETARQQQILIGTLNREAEQQAATIQQLREEVERWRTRLTCTYGSGRPSSDQARPSGAAELSTDLSPTTVDAQKRSQPRNVVPHSRDTGDESLR